MDKLESAKSFSQKFLHIFRGIFFAGVMSVLGGFLYYYYLYRIAPSHSVASSNQTVRVVEHGVDFYITPFDDIVLKFLWAAGYSAIILVFIFDRWDKKKRGVPLDAGVRGSAFEKWIPKPSDTGRDIINFAMIATLFVAISLVASIVGSGGGFPLGAFALGADGR